MTTRRLAMISMALLMSASLVACGGDPSHETNNSVVDAGADAQGNDAGSDDAGSDDTGGDDTGQDAGDLGGPSDAGDVDETSDASDASDAADVGADGESDGGDDVGVDTGPVPDDLDPTGGSWSTDYSMPGLQGQSGARGYVLADDPTNAGFYVGGSFGVAGGAIATNIAYWDGTKWNKIGAIDLAIDVHALAVDSVGNLYAGGEGGGGFGIGGSSTLEMWDGTSWSIFAEVGGGVAPVIYDIEMLSDGRIVIAGEFGDVDWNPLSNLAVYDGTGWSMLGNGDSPSGAVRDVVEMSDGRICIGGDFAQVGTLTVNNVSCWDGTEWMAMASGVNSSVYALIEDGGDLLAGGSFSVLESGVTTIGLARWNGTKWQGEAGGVQGGSVTSVRALTHGINGELFVGGTFTSAGFRVARVAVTNVAKLDNGQWSGLGSGVENTVGVTSGAVIGVNDMLITDSSDTLVATGLFSMIGDKFSLNIGEWTLGSIDDTGWSKIIGQGEHFGADASVVALETAPSGTVYGSGSFSTLGGRQIERVAQFDNGSWQPLPGFLIGDVTEIVIDSTGLAYFGGSFNLSTSGPSIANLAVWNGTTWSAMGAAVPGEVVAMAVDQNDKLYVATTSSATNDYRVHEWTGSSWQQLGGAFSDRISAMAVMPGGDLYIGGWFDEDANAVSMPGVARWDGTAWVDVGGGIGTSGRVNEMTIWGTELLVVGKFSEAGGQAAGSVALWDGTTWDTLGGGLPPRYPNSPPPTVTAAAAKANGFFVSGTFPSIGQLSVNYIAWWDGQDWHALGDGLSDLGEAMTITDHQLIVGGPFTEAGGHPSYHIGVWDYQPTP